MSRPGSTGDRKSTRLNSSHLVISYAVFCLKKKKKKNKKLQHQKKTKIISLHVCCKLCNQQLVCFFVFFFFNDTATTEIYTLSLHDALPISSRPGSTRCGPRAAHPARPRPAAHPRGSPRARRDRKSTRLNSSHLVSSYA